MMALCDSLSNVYEKSDFIAVPRSATQNGTDKEEQNGTNVKQESNGDLAET